MIQVIVEHISEHSFLTINDMVDHKISEYSRIDDQNNWQISNQLSWKKKFSDGRHFKLITIDMYDPNIPAFYLVSLNDCYDRYNTTWVRLLRQDTVEFLRKNNITILLSQPLEHTYDFINQDHNENRLSQNLNNLDRMLCNRGLEINDLIIHGISKIHRKFWTLNQRRVNDVFSYHFLTEAAGTVKLEDEYGRSNYSNFCMFEDHVNSFDTKNKQFICLNRVPRELRTLFFLKNRHHLQNAHYTFLAEEPPWVQMSQHQLDIRIEESCNNEKLKHLIKYKNDLLTQAPITLQGDDTTNQRENDFLNALRKDVWYEIVMETHDYFYHKIPMSILSEKITWPILNHLPFVTVGHRMNKVFLEHIGFKTFDDIFFGEHEHRNTGTDVLDYLDCLDQAIQSYTKKCNSANFIELKDRICHNYNHLVNTDWHEVEKNNLLNPWGFHN